MSEQIFSDPPRVELLQWLARGSLKQNLLRSIRLWACLQFLYGEQKIKEPFSFSNWRDAFFSATHPKGDSIPQLHDSGCACAKTTADWIFSGKSGVNEREWRQAIEQHDDIADAALNDLLQRQLFALTRRSLYKDLEILAELGWLERQGKSYCRVKNWPTRPLASSSQPSDGKPNTYDSELPNIDLATIVQNLREPIAGVKRFFLEVDYIIHQANQDRVDDWHEQLKRLWQQNPVPPIRITYNSARQGAAVKCIVYPVCLYYMQRAIYLCACGQTPNRQGEWYNYRLDRIQQMHSLEWKDEDIPQLLLKYYPQNLPHPDSIRERMEEVWGFDFYQEPQLMLLRFDRKFHDLYIEGTFRHDTFKICSFDRAKQLIRQNVPQPEQQQVLLTVLNSRSRLDAYYQVLYRDGDTNVRMRLRSWRPHGEVLLPWELRQGMTHEVEKEVQFYRNLLG